MNPQYLVAGERLDLLDLKVALVTRGVQVSDEIYEKFGKTARISRNPRACNTLFLPGQIVAHLWDVPESPFRLIVSPDGTPALKYEETPICEVSLPPAVQFYRRKTTTGVPFGEAAIIQGCDILAFPYLWDCEIAKSGSPCKFCHSGTFTLRLQASGSPVEPEPWKPRFRPEEVAEIVRQAVLVDREANMLQLTAGSSLDADAEARYYLDVLKAIDSQVGTKNVAGGITLFITPPKDFSLIDRLLESGATRIACDLDVWDEKLFARICPGKTRVTTRRRYIDALLYTAKKFGPNVACSVFVTGLEPIDSFLEGVRFLSENGVVPLPSTWTPFGGLNSDLPIPPGLDYYRIVRREVARCYRDNGLTAPGDCGSNVCLSRDITRFMNELADET